MIYLSETIHFSAINVCVDQQYTIKATKPTTTAHLKRWSPRAQCCRSTPAQTQNNKQMYQLTEPKFEDVWGDVSTSQSLEMYQKTRTESSDDLNPQSDQSGWRLNKLEQFRNVIIYHWILMIIDTWYSFIFHIIHTLYSSSLLFDPSRSRLLLLVVLCVRSVAIPQIIESTLTPATWISWMCIQQNKWQ